MIRKKSVPVRCLLAGVLLLAAGCAVLTVDVDVYKGPLANTEEIQGEQVISLAMGVKPLLVQLRDHLAVAKVLPTRNQGYVPIVAPATLQEDLIKFRTNQWYRTGYIHEINNSGPDGYVFTNELSLRVNDILGLYGDRGFEELAPLIAQAKRVAGSYRRNSESYKSLTDRLTNEQQFATIQTQKIQDPKKKQMASIRAAAQINALLNEKKLVLDQGTKDVHDLMVIALESVPKIHNATNISSSVRTEIKRSVADLAASIVNFKRLEEDSCLVDLAKALNACGKWTQEINRTQKDKDDWKFLEKIFAGVMAEDNGKFSRELLAADAKIEGGLAMAGIYPHGTTASDFLKLTGRFEEAGSILSRGRPTSGLEASIDEYLKQDVTNRQIAQLSTNTPFQELLSNLAQFGQKVVTVGNSALLFNEGQNNADLRKYVTVMQAVGNSILVSVDELKQQAIHHEKIKKRSSVVAQTINEAAGITNSGFEFDANKKTMWQTNQFDAKDAAEHLVTVLRAEYIKALREGSGTPSGTNYTDVALSTDGILNSSNAVSSVINVAGAVVTNTVPLVWNVPGYHPKITLSNELKISFRSPIRIVVTNFTASTNAAAFVFNAATPFTVNITNLLRGDFLTSAQLPKADDFLESNSIQVTLTNPVVVYITNAVSPTNMNSFSVNLTNLFTIIATNPILVSVTNPVHGHPSTYSVTVNTNIAVYQDTNNPVTITATNFTGVATNTLGSNLIQCISVTSTNITNLIITPLPTNLYTITISNPPAVATATVHMTNVLSVSAAANKYLQAIKAATELRSGMIYLRPASAYLRSSYPSSNLDHGAGQGWYNMLTKHASRQAPFIGAELSGDRNADTETQAQIDRLSWQKVNQVRVGGAGNVNYVIAKDDVGNWYVRNFSTDPSRIAKSAKNLAFFAAGDAFGGVLPIRKSAGDILQDTNSVLSIQYAQAAASYAVQTSNTFQHLVDRAPSLEGQIKTQWTAAGITNQSIFDASDSSFKIVTKTIADAQTNVDSVPRADTDAKVSALDMETLRILRSIKRYSISAGAGIASTNSPDASAHPLMVGTVRSFLDDFVNERNQAIGRFESALDVINGATVSSK